MKRSALVILGGAALLIAAFAVRTWLPDRSPVPVAPSVAPPAAAPTPSTPFEAAFQALRGELDGLRRDVERLRALESRLRPFLETAGAPSAPRMSTPLRLPPGATGRAAAVADLLGLDEGRRKVFEQAHEQFQAKVRAVEANRGVLKREGAVTTVTVPAFAARGQELAREWSAQLRSLLLPEELRRYQEHGLESSLFEGGIDDLGSCERVVTVTASGTDRFSVVETRTSAEGGRKNQYTLTRAGSEEVLAPYRHLLDR